MKIRGVWGAAAFVALCAGWPGAADARTVLDRTIPVSGVRVVQLATGGGDVTMIPDLSPGAPVHVTIERNGAGTAPEVSSTRAGNRLVLALSAPGGSLVPFAASATMSYRISYPAALRLDVRASSGAISIAKPSAAVQIYDQDGTIVIDDPRGPVTAETARGNVTVNRASTTIDLAADGGDVTASLTRGWSGGEIRMQTGSGSVRLAVNPGFRGRFDATSGTGAVHNDFGKSNARSPLVWLYAPSGEVWITIAR